MSRPKCSKCGVDVMTTALFRVNPTGEKAIWLCELCARDAGKGINTDMLDLTDVIQRDR